MAERRRTRGLFEARRRLGRGHFPRTARRAVACREKKRQRGGGTWLFNEARAVGMVQHPGLVRVHDYQQTAAGNAYIVMEFLQGESLAARIDAAHQLGHGLPLPLALHIGGQVAAALAAAHAAGVVHCDLKPENVLLAQEADAVDGVRAKILDFGIAKFLTASTGKQTTVGLILGTPSYMAPEQCEGRDNLTDRVDVYSLGVILYQMLTGRPPFVAQSGSALMRQHMVMEPPLLRKLLPTVSAALHELVHAMLTKAAAARPTMAQVVARLQTLREQHGADRGPLTRRRMTAVALGVVLLTVGGAGAAFLVNKLRHPAQPQIAASLPLASGVRFPVNPGPVVAVPSHLEEDHHLTAAGEKQHRHKPGKPTAKEAHLAASASPVVPASGQGGSAPELSSAPVPTTLSTPAKKTGSHLTNGDIEPDR